MFGKRGFLRRSENFFSEKFWRLEKRFYNAVYSKAKQTANEYGEKRNEKIYRKTFQTKFFEKDWINHL